MRFGPNTLLVTDLDACLVNTWEMVQIFVWDYYGVWVPESACKEFQVSSGIFNYLVDHGANVPHVAALERRLTDGLWTVPGWYHEARPHYLYWQALLCWQRAGRWIRFLTARPSNLEAVTHGWLRRWGFEIGRGHLVIEEGSKNKIQHLKRWAKANEVTFIDDRLSTIKEASQIEGVEAVLFANSANAKAPSALPRLTEQQLAQEILAGLG